MKLYLLRHGEAAEPDHRRLRQEVLARLGDGRAEWLARG